MSTHDMSMHDMHDMPMDDPMAEMCQMNMLFTWDWRNSCVVYEWWHVKTLPGFLSTLVAIAALSVFYEYLRFRAGRWRAKFLQGLGPAPISRAARARSAALYAVQVGYSFMLMLIFMTYNGWYMIAVVVGAGLGFFVWGDLAENRSMVCH